jgi:beta-D-xylosidase 4
MRFLVVFVLVFVLSFISTSNAYLPHGQACLSDLTTGLPFCDPTLPRETRVADLIGRLNLTEKIALMGTYVGDVCAGVDGGVPRLDIQPISCLIECTGAVSSNCYVDGDTGASYCPTVFPAPLSTAASFNRSLFRLRGSVIGQEARAFNNLNVTRIYGNSVDLLAFGPDLNLIVDPRNGRNGENPSEDGYLAGSYAIEYVKGAQLNEEDPFHIQLSMALKHFAGYQSETNRFVSNFSFSTFDLLDTFLKPFELGFKESPVSGTMCSYNSLNNISACADSWLLTSMVREYWGRSDVYIMSDCGAIEDQIEKHDAINFADAAAKSLTAGCDWAMGTDYVMENGLRDAISEGLLNISQIDEALTRTLSVRFQLGMFDSTPESISPFTTFGAEKINSIASKEAAELAAAQGAVLLRNSKNILPLSLSDTNFKTIAVVGPHAMTQRDLLGDFYADAFCPGINTPQTRAEDCVPTFGASVVNVLASSRPDVEVIVSQGVSIAGSNLSGIPIAIDAVNISDVCLLLVGYNNADIEREGADHNFTTLPAGQLILADAVIVAATKRGIPVVMILVNAGQIALDNLLIQPDVIIEAFYPSFGAPAIIKQIFGLLNRWGRLPYTIYDSSFASAIPLSDMNVSGTVGRTWRYHTLDPNYKFGDGLSYSNFSLVCSGNGGNINGTNPESISIPINCTSAITSGMTIGDEILLVIHQVGDDVKKVINGQHPIPFGTLRDFNRITIDEQATSGESLFLLKALDLALVSNSGASCLYPGTHFITVSPRGGVVTNFTLTVNVTTSDGLPIILAQPPVMPGGR